MTTHPIVAALSREQNPVLEAEFRHQRFIIQRSRAGLFWIALAVLLVVPSMLVSLFYIAAAVFNFLTPIEFYDFISTPHAITSVLLIILNISLYPVVVLVTMALSANSISREKSGKTWGLLKLTEVKPEQIVFGKWWASLRALNGDQYMVLIGRLGLVAFFTSVLLPALVGLQGGDPVPHQTYFLLLLPIVLIHWAIDAALSAALGIVAAAPDNAFAAISGSTASIVRLILALISGVWLVDVLYLLVSDASLAFIHAGIGIVVYIGFLLLALFAGYMIVARS